MNEFPNILKNMYPFIGVGIAFLLVMRDYLSDKQRKSIWFNTVFIFALFFHMFSFFVNYVEPEFFMFIWVLRDAFLIWLIHFTWKLFRRFKFTSVSAVLFVLSLYFYKTGEIPFYNSIKENIVSPKAYSEILFDIKDHAYLNDIKKLLSPYEPEIFKSFPHVKDIEDTDLDDYYSIDLKEKFIEKIPEIIEKLYNSGYVDWVEENEIYSLDTLGVNKTYETVETKAALEINDKQANRVWGFDYMKINELRKYLSGNPGVKKARIFILDTGIDKNHEDLSKNYVSIYHKYDFDRQGHGTHCAGIANAVSNNGIGIASLNLTNNFATVTSIKVLNNKAKGSQETIIDGIILAANSGADVISLSLGGVTTKQKELAYGTAIDYAINKGAIVVVAAGNRGDNAVNYAPACCKNVIVVSAVDHELKKAKFSNYVSDIEMKVSAPGVNIFSTYPYNRYKAMNGTSMATPYVAGLIAIMKSISPELTVNDVYRIFEKTGIETQETELTGKMINPLDAIKELSSERLKIRFKLRYFNRKLFLFKPE